MWTEPDDDALRELLNETRTVAVVGVSPDPMRPSNGVYHYLRSNTGWTLYPVNPLIGELDGCPAYPDLAALPVVPDMVDVFRRPDQLRSVLRQAVAVGAKSIWLQQGLWDEQLALDAQAAGLAVVMDRCLKVEHARLL
ncbi:MAG: CoA-binding protein [Mycobacteriaceae bacterium]|nr:CoA-binding protein [Mycobacteriaceae bacterium]